MHVLCDYITSSSLNIDAYVYRMPGPDYTRDEGLSSLKNFYSCSELITTLTHDLPMHQTTLFDDEVVSNLLDLVAPVDVGALMQPAAPTQSSTIRKDSPAHSPYLCYGIPHLFRSLMCG